MKKTCYAIAACALLGTAPLALLQAQGLPLRRIRELLLGRSLSDLREIRERGRKEAASLRSRFPAPAAFTPGEPWQLLPLASDAALLLKSPSSLSADQLQQIQKILASGPSHQNGPVNHND